MKQDSKIKTFFLTATGLLLVVFMYCIYVIDKALCVFAVGPRIGFRKWLHNPSVKVLRQDGEIDHNLQTVSILRVAFFGLCYFIFTLIW
jgi:hypothetical protein